MIDKIIEILKNKKTWIIIVIVFLAISYIIVENITENDFEIEHFDYSEDNENVQDGDIAENEINEDNLVDEVNLQDETNLEVESNLETEENYEDSNLENNEEDKNIEQIYVYITGEVNNPGVITLNEGSRIVDAIEAAGGVTSKANISKVNLVYVLQDGMKVNIPSDEDLKNNSNFEYITMSSGDEKNDANIATSTSSNSSNSNDDSAFKISVVNINTATQTELETLPGIGPSIALKIIMYRQENGNFTSIEELKNVSGIGDSKFESIKEYVRV